MKPPIKKKRRKRRRKPKFGADSKLSARARAILERTARARAEIDAYLASPDPLEEEQTVSAA